MVCSTELYYGGEAFTADQPQAFTCPYCGKMGFTESALQEHVTSEHSDASIEVVSVLWSSKVKFISVLLRNVQFYIFWKESTGYWKVI